MTKKKKTKPNSDKKKSWADLSPKQREKAKEMYMDYMSITEISSLFNIPRTTVQYHANTHWDVEREMNRADLFARFASTKKKSLVELSDYSLKILNKALHHLANRDEPPSPREARDAIVILESLDKINRLDEGRPTEITEEKVMEFKDIEAVANMVPFKTKEKIVYIEEESDEEIDEDKPN